MAEEDVQQGQAGGAPTELEVPVGVPLSVFKTGVDAMEDLVRRDEAVVFISRPYRVRFLVDLAVWGDAFHQRLGKQLTEQPASATLSVDVKTEILRCLQACLMWESSPALLLEDQLTFRLALSRLPSEQKSEGMKVVEKKAAYVRDHLLTTPMRERVIRLSAAAGPCPEELDVEVVTERLNYSSDRYSPQPFIRAHLRYTQADGVDAYTLKAWGQSAFSADIIPTHTLSMELDETDIDLLVERLLTAKRLLLSSLNAKTKPEAAEEK